MGLGWAEAEFKKAIEVNPSDAGLRVDYSHYLMIMKRPEDATAQMQRAQELDPLNELIQTFSGVFLTFAGRDDEAIVVFRKALRTSPGLPPPYGMLSNIFFRKGMHEESLAEMRAYCDAIGDREFAEALTQGYAQSGYSGAMRRAADMLTARARKTYVNPPDVASLYARMNLPQ